MPSRRHTTRDSNGVIFLETPDWSILAKQIEKAGRTVARMTNSVAATTAALGRSSYSDVMQRKFPKMGRQAYRKEDKSGVRGTYFDPQIGGFRSRTRHTSNGDLRESNFSFETVAAHRSKNAFGRSVARVRLTSLTANLWEENHKYYSDSSAWQYTGEGQWHFWKKGDTRKARPFFLGVARQRVYRSASEAIKRTEDRFRGEFE
jgi:hypothetical protein